MSLASVLLAMGGEAESKRCTHTGLSIPECCCAACWRALLRRYRPQAVGSAAERSRESDAAPICTAEHPGGRGTVEPLHGQARQPKALQ
jgi:hypothetical protein